MWVQLLLQACAGRGPAFPSLSSLFTDYVQILELSAEVTNDAMQLLASRGPCFKGAPALIDALFCVLSNATPSQLFSNFRRIDKRLLQVFLWR